MTTQKTGKFKCSIEEYNSYPAARNTLLKILIDRTPAHYLYALEHPSEPTPAKEMGSAIHQAMLEPKLFKEKMIVTPVFEGKTKDGKITTNANATEVKEKAAKWHMENHGKTILTPEQHYNIDGMLSAVSKHKKASELISEGHAEESLFWTDPETGIQCKARPDFIREGHILVDLKSTEDASPATFKKDCLKYGYHFQAAMYLDAATAVYGQTFDTFVIVAVEKSAPWGVCCHYITEETLREGQSLFYKSLGVLKKCMDTKTYPAYPNELMPLSLPTYGFRTEQE
jgi:exodeoxyribonuclease VIII